MESFWKKNDSPPRCRARGDAEGAEINVYNSLTCLLVIPVNAGIQLLFPLPFGEHPKSGHKRAGVRGKTQSVFYVCYLNPNPNPNP